MRIIASLFIVMLLLNCAAQEKDVIVTVNGSTLTKKEFEQYVPDADYEQIGEDRINAFLEDWIQQEILYLQAKKTGVDKEDSVRFVLDQYAKNFLAMELVRREFGTTTVTEKEIREYFDQHKDEFLYAVKLGQIVLPTRELAMRTSEEIKAGADFFKLARERSLTRYQDPENPRIITEYLPRGVIADFAIEELIFSMAPGEVSEAIPYVQGTFLIVKMVDKRKIKAQVELTDEIKGQIYNYLLASKYQTFLEGYVDSLKATYKITSDLSALKK
ncbi:MAG: peptidyl-prolyl cis-trans isomerase [candidate division WOR-3 bacterium]|nr:MAG: peptidyl-prolyl cis-trans isomerase [candidate division WOR-3 bacterium]